MGAITWIVRRIRSALIVYAVIWLISEIIPIMSKVTETIQEGIANPKATGAIATTGGGTAIYDSITQAAPDVLMYLSIVSAGLAVWAHFGTRKRKRLEQEQKAEAHKAEMENRALEKRVLEQQIKESEVREEGQRLFIDHVIKKHPALAEDVGEDGLNSIIEFAAKKKAQ